MNSEPEVGEYVGMTRDQPGEKYMLPEFPSSEYYTLLYVYDNSANQIVSPEQTTTLALPRPTHVREFLRMIITVRWTEGEFDPSSVVVHDSTHDTFGNLLQKFGFDEIEE